MSSASSETIRFIDREEVARRLTYERCIPIVRDAMIALSRGETQKGSSCAHTSRSPRDESSASCRARSARIHAPFGAKLISVFRDNAAKE